MKYTQTHSFSETGLILSPRPRQVYLNVLLWEKARGFKLCIVGVVLLIGSCPLLPPFRADDGCAQLVWARRRGHPPPSSRPGRAFVNDFAQL